MTNPESQPTHQAINPTSRQAVIDEAQKKPLSMKRLVPIALLLGCLGIAFSLDIHHYFNIEFLKQNRDTLLGWQEQNFTLSAIVFVAVYGIATAISLPGAIWITLFSGFLFGTFSGGLLVLLGATSGATVIFLAARYAFADFFHAKLGDNIRRMEQGIKENAFSYLLVLRFIPLFPFWLVNLVPAFLGVSLRVYVISTFIGIIPGTFVYASLGSGLGKIIDDGGVPDLGAIWKPEFLVPLIGLSVLALLAPLYRRYTAGKAKRSHDRAA